MVILAGARSWGGLLEVRSALVVSMGLFLLGLSSLVAIWTVQRVGRALQLALLLGAVAGFAVLATITILHSPTYGTDEIAFDQYAAMFALHGVNPYLQSMAPSLSFFHVPDVFRTYLLNGGVVGRLSYPAGAFLAYVPSLALGMHMQAAVVTDSVAWIVGIVLAWWLLPRSVAWVAPLMLLSSVYLGYTAGGVSDTLYLPLLVVALWRWDRYGDGTERSWARWVGPVALGLACSIKQTPWFVAVFLVVGVALEAASRDPRWWRVAGRYFAVALGVFAAVNLPYALLDPVTWSRSVLVPFISPTEPGGQGLVGLTMFEHLGGQLRYYTLAGAFAMVAALAAFANWYQYLKRAWVFLIALAFFWPMRSFGSYMIMLLPAALIATTTVRDAPTPRPRSAHNIRLVRFGVGVVLVASLCSAVAAVTLSPSLSLRILSEGSTGEMQTIDYLTMLVTNTSSHPVHPHYAVTPTGQISSFWNVVGGPSSVAAHASARVTVEAPNTQSMPSINGGFIVDAFTAHPAQMATSRNVHLDQQSTVLSPEDVNHRQFVARPLTMHVQVVNRIGDAVLRRGVPIDLGQVVYGQSGLAFGEASINGQPEGQSPVEAFTNRAGVATFTVTGVQAQEAPVFWQAWIIRPNTPPSGYSNTVSIQYVVPNQVPKG